MEHTNLDRARVALVIEHPFFASLLLKRRIIEDRTIPTAAVDQRGQIYINPDFAAKLSVPQLDFLYAHEIGHVIGQQLCVGKRQPIELCHADAAHADRLGVRNPHPAAQFRVGLTLGVCHTH
jgi:hypothetical protein